MLAVDPGAQGQGLGEALVQASIDVICAADRKRVVISSAADMVAAHRLYERLGFTRAPQRDWRPVPDVAAARLRAGAVERALQQRDRALDVLAGRVLLRVHAAEAEPGEGGDAPSGPMSSESSSQRRPPGIR